MSLRQRTSLIPAIIVLISVSLGACVSKGKYLSQVAEKDGLAQSLKHEREKMARLSQEKEEFDQARRTQEATIKALNEELANRDQQMAQLDQRVLAQKQENDRLNRSLRLSEEEMANREKQAQERLQVTEQMIGKLKSEIDEGNIKISQLEGKLTLQIVDKILFASGSDQITPTGKEVLKKVSDVLKDIQENQVSIEGHTDNVPIGARLVNRFPSNWELSTARATQVVRYLTSLGVDPARMGVSGFSEYRPIAPNDTPENQQQNRRIEIVLTPERSAQALGGSP
jgi:chemotaxis protein MotB